MKWIGTQTIYDHVRLVKGITLDSVSITTIQSSGESFVDNDTSLMTSAAVADKIEAYGYSTTAGDITGVTAGTGLSGGGTTGAVTLNVDASIPEITTLAGLTSFGAAGATTNIVAGDVTMYNTVNDGNPTISLGSSATERFEIKSQYESGAQGLDVVKFTTYTAGSSANDARFSFFVDEVNIFQLKDAGVNIPQSLNLSIGGVDILADSSGTTTLSNIDALDATTEATIESAIDTLSNLTAASSLVTVGTIGTGTWQGTAVASAYLDADTMHYSAQRQITHHSFADDIDTTKHYIGFTGGDQEATATTGTMVPLLAPVGGKLLKIFLRSNKNLNSLTFTWRLETQAGVNFGTGPSVVGTQSGVGCQNSTMTTYDFTTGLDSGDNLIDAGDMVYISIQSDGATATTKFYMTCLWEWDLS